MAATVIYNDQGVPLMAYGKNYFASTTGIPEKTKYTEQIQDVDNTVSIGNTCVVLGHPGITSRKKPLKLSAGREF